jgi:hypothetical protein
VLQSFKNVSLSPVDCGGRVLAVGEIAELHPHAHGVRDAVATGDLLAVTTFAEPPAQATAGDDEAADEAPEKPARRAPPGAPTRPLRSPDMARPQITITTSAASAAATPGQRLGTWFVAAQTERGPLLPDPTTPLYSIQDYAALYGTRASLGSVQTTYDQLDAYWRTGGGPVLLSRVVGPAAASAC